MLNIGLSELILILLVAFLVVGPKDLPKVARGLGKFIKFLKSKWSEFLEETELGDTVKEFQDAQKDIKELGKELKQTVRSASPLEEIKEAADQAKTVFEERKQEETADP